jgi:hypothetical protein
VARYCGTNSRRCPPVFVKGVVLCRSGRVSDFGAAGVTLGVEADVAGTWGSQPIPGTSTISSAGRFIGYATPTVESTVAVSAVGLGFRPAQAQLASLSTVESYAAGYRPAVSYTLQGTSLISHSVSATGPAARDLEYCDPAGNIAEL